MIVVVDNYDSFTYNLVQYLGELGAAMTVVRNDQASVEEIAALAPQSPVRPVHVRQFCGSASKSVDQRPKRTHPPPVSKHLECLSFHENWWAPVQRRSASKRCPPQCQKQLTSQSVKPTLRVGPLWTPIYMPRGSRAFPCR